MPSANRIAVWRTERRQASAGRGRLAQREFQALVTIRSSDRPWELPFAVAVAAGMPMLLGAWLGGMSHASLASIGAMTLLYVPRTRFDHRMATVMAAGFAMIACLAFGLLRQLVPAARVPIIAFVSILVVMGCRYFRVGPPGALFFIMATAIGAYTPGQVADAPMKLGFFALGVIGAVIDA